MPQPDNASPTPNTLKIVTRISPTKKATSDSPEYHNVYHWDRIIGVAVLLGAGLVFALYFAISSIVSPPSVQNAAIPSTALETAPETTPETTPELRPSNTAPGNEKATSPPPLISMDSKTESLISEANTALSVASPSAGSPTPKPPVINIHSNDINRALFSHTLKNKEPNSIITDTVTLDEGGLSRVYFFTDVKDRAGDTLTHTWYRNGKKVVKVRTPIGSDTWRCSSSKYLDKTMPGDWEVKVTDKKGKLVASGSFVFVTS